MSVASTVPSLSPARQINAVKPSSQKPKIDLPEPYLTRRDQFLKTKNEIPSWSTEEPCWQTTTENSITWTDWPDLTPSKMLPNLPGLSALPEFVPNLDSAISQIPELPTLIQSAMQKAFLSFIPTIEINGSCYTLCFPANTELH